MSEVWEKKIDILHKLDHYEGYLDGEFICSGDTVVEVAKEMEDHVEKLRAGVV